MCPVGFYQYGAHSHRVQWCPYVPQSTFLCTFFSKVYVSIELKHNLFFLIHQTEEFLSKCLLVFLYFCASSHFPSRGGILPFGAVALVSHFMNLWKTLYLDINSRLKDNPILVLLWTLFLCVSVNLGQCRIFFFLTKIFNVHGLNWKFIILSFSYQLSDVCSVQSLISLWDTLLGWDETHKKWLLQWVC